MDQRANFLALILLDALEDENESDVYSILEKNSVDASFVPQERGIAPLHYGCGMQNEELAIEVTKRFLASGADPNVRSDENMTPLHVAALYGRTEIVELLLQHGAQLDVVDNERKMPVHYAIEECHFEVVQLMRDHIFVDKYERKKQQNQQHEHSQQNSLLSQTKFEHSLRQSSTPNRDADGKTPVNKNLLTVSNSHDDSVPEKYSPNRINYNYDVTSPYYINITHRRHRPQPKFPALSSPAPLNGSRSQTPRETVNIFTLTKENLQEMTQTPTAAENSHISLIETWREKVQKSRARQSILKKYDDVGEMIDNVMESEHLNFTNTILKEKSKTQAGEVDSGAACGSTTSSMSESGGEYTVRPMVANISLGKIIQKVAQAHLVDLDAESSYQTVPEMLMESKENSNQLQVPKQQLNDTSCFIRSPNSGEYFLQMTEAYVHTDDENGLVFYEKKLLTNQGNKVAQERSPVAGSKKQPELDSTATSQSTNLTLPVDYETDALRAELTLFGEPPGPITKSTKRLYIKRLIKYKRKTTLMQELKQKQGSNETKFSVELQRTVRSVENFERIPDYMKYETQSMLFFANNKQKKPMREGHLKQSFIYMLIDPRVSCNLPGESAFLQKFDIWKRFLQAIFYVGKGKTSRPYSHLYAAMKAHSRMHNLHLNNELGSNGKKISIKKQPFNIDLFKSPPQQSSDCKKLDRILDIWGHGSGVVCLHVFHNIVPTEAYTREAAIIDALSVQHLTNVKRGDYYGPAQTWTMKEKKYLGIALLYKAMQIFLAEGESQLSPSDLI